MDTEKKPYDPKLREAAEEFKAICKKFDCAGVGLFVSPTHSEFINELSPSWSVITPEEGGFRFRSKKSDFPSIESQKYATETTVHILTSIAEWTRKTNVGMHSVIRTLGDHMRIAWKTWDTPDSVPGDGK